MSEAMNRAVEVFAIIGFGAIGSMIVVTLGVAFTGRGMDR